MSGWRLAAVVVGLGTLAVFAGAIRFYFHRGAAAGRGALVLLAAIAACGAAQVVALFAADDVPVWCRATGLLMFAAAHAVFWSTVAAHGHVRPEVAFSPSAPARLVTFGPYRWVRHPFYTAYLLAWVAGAVVTATPALALCVGVMGAVYWSAACREEAAIVASPLGNQYCAYARRTGMFLPRLARPEPPSLAPPADAGGIPVDRSANSSSVAELVAPSTRGDSSKSSF